MVGVPRARRQEWGLWLASWPPLSGSACLAVSVGMLRYVTLVAKSSGGAGTNTLMLSRSLVLPAPAAILRGPFVPGQSHIRAVV